MTDTRPLRRTTQSEFDLVATMVIDYVKSENRPISVGELIEKFTNVNIPLDAGRVTLQLLADGSLYLTEDRKIKI